MSAQAIGKLGVEVFTGIPETRGNLWENFWRLALPHRGLPREVNAWRIRNLPKIWHGLWRVFFAWLLHIPTHFGALYIDVIRRDGQRVRLGLASLRVVTDAGVGFIVDAFENLTELENMKFHGIGTGTNSELAANTALQTELTTQYNPDNTRATGSTTETTANVFRTVGTNTVDAGASITEHGIFSQAATGGGVLLDRSVFSAVILGSGDSLQTTYDFTLTSGG